MVKRARGANESDANGTESKKPNLSAAGTKGTWISIENGAVHVYMPNAAIGAKKVAAFDIDGTVITTKSGKVFPKDENDWQFWSTSVPAKINEAREKEDRRIVFFTNQKGISIGKQPLEPLKRKIEAICGKLRAPVLVFVSTTGTSYYRKPYIGMWSLFEEHYNDGIKAKKKDFSCSDRLFALNLGVPFQTPEQFFNGEKADTNFSMPAFNPKKAVADAEKQPLLIDKKTGKALSGVNDDNIKTPQVIVMVGAPASGKSHFVRKHLLTAGFVHINRDTLKTWQKCIAALEEHLRKGKSVVVDNTNPDFESRARYVQAALKTRKDVRLRAFVMNVTEAQCAHNNRYRLLKGADAAHLNVNDMVMRMFWSKYKPVDATKEKFAQVVDVNLRPEFDNEKDKEMYELYLVER